MPWYKSYTSHSSGHRNATYHYFASKKDFESFSIDYIDKMDSYYEYSDKYHGVVFEKVKKPPTQWLLDQLNRYKKDLSEFDKKMANRKDILLQRISFYRRQLS